VIFGQPLHRTEAVSAYYLSKPRRFYAVFVFCRAWQSFPAFAGTSFLHWPIVKPSLQEEKDENVC
jgi:hypothetical protein